VATAHSQHFQPHWMFNDLVIAVSEATRRFHRRFNLVRRHRIVTIHNFVAPTHLPNPDAVRHETRASLGVGDEQLLLGIVGTVYQTKGHIYLVRALPKILAATDRARLAIIGDERSPRYAQMLRSEAQRLGVADRIIWAGQRSDMPAIMVSLDLCVAPSLHENMPMAVLEAMSAGVAVVATSVGGVPECVVPEETGLLVRARDSHALANAVNDLLANANRRHAFGVAGHARVRDHFSPDSQVTCVEAALSRAAACHPIAFARAA
jgi:glycosyltransferase involved in cell wall biosynthesis